MRIAVIAEYEDSELAASVEIEFADQVFKFNQERFHLRRREHVEQRVAGGNMSDEHRLGACQELFSQSAEVGAIRLSREKVREGLGPAGGIVVERCNVGNVGSGQRNPGPGADFIAAAVEVTVLVARRRRDVQHSGERGLTIRWKDADHCRRAIEFPKIATVPKVLQDAERHTVKANHQPALGLPTQPGPRKVPERSLEFVHHAGAINVPRVPGFRRTRAAFDDPFVWPASTICPFRPRRLQQ